MGELVAIEPEGVDADLIERLEHALEKARGGQVSSVAIALVYRDGSTSTAWSSPPHWAALLGAVHHMAWRLSFKKNLEN